MQFVKLLAVALVGIGVSVSSAFSEPSEAQRKFFEIDLKCPSEDNWALQLILANQLHVYTRTVVHYEHNVAIIISVYFSTGTGRPFQELKWIDLRTEKDPDERRYAELVEEKRSAPLMRDVCQGSEESRRRYFESLEANKVRLGLQ